MQNGVLSSIPEVQVTAIIPSVALLLGLLLLPGPASAQAPAKPWSVEEIHGPALDLKYTVDEGTWVSVDVSPDGRTLIFDLLGDLYTLPIAGGKATRFTSGTRWDATPRFSPDGRRVLFASDPSGSDQLWVIPVEGGTPTMITKEGNYRFGAPSTGSGYQYGSPSWDPSGQFIFTAREALPGSRLGEYVIMHHQGGSGTPVAEDGAAGLVASADGRWLYYTVENRIVRLDRRTGEKTTVVSGYADIRRPAISPSGRLLSFATSIDAVPRLILRDLGSGRDRILYSGLDYARRFGSGDLDDLPGYAFTPDERAIVFTADGKIRRVDLASGAMTVIPFTADIELTVTKIVNPKHELSDGPFSPKVLHWVQALGANELILGAAGKLYRYDTKSRRATPFANGPGLQYAPAVSPDGRWVAYVDWVDSIGGRLMKAPAAGGRETSLGVRPGRYQNISWSLDGKKLVVSEQRMEADGYTEQGYYFHWLDAERGGELHIITAVTARGNWRKPPQRATFDESGERIYYTVPHDTAAPGAPSFSYLPLAVRLCSVTLDGADRQCIAHFDFADELMPSPDGRWVLYTEMQNVYLAALPPPGKDPTHVQSGGGAFPVYLLGPQGDYLYWMDGGKRLLWSWGPKVYQVDLASASSGERVAPQVTDVSFELPRVQGKGHLLLSNARLITMKGDEILESGDILVSNGRIAAVGRAGQVEAPAGATTMDLSGKTIIPGFIDLHAHLICCSGAQGQGHLYLQQNPFLIANLAYGVTTWRDPSIRSQTLFGMAELVEAGTTLGPRMHGTGDIFMHVKNHCCGVPNNLEDARRLVRNQKALGATSIKDHTVPRRDQVQWIIQASREEGLQIVEDPARGPRREIRPMMDGATSLEHVYAAAPAKKDVIELLARTGGFYVPTLVSGGFESYFVTTTSPHDDEKLRRFTPHVFLDREVRGHNQWLMPHEIPTWRSEILRDLVRAGGKVGMGSHGQVQGLGSHWEVWAMASGGLTPFEALRSATLTGAEAMGMQDDLGSLEPGKLADLMVLDRNPLVDLRNTNSIRYVMKAGVMWEGDTMDEVWPNKRKLNISFNQPPL